MGFTNICTLLLLLLQKIFGLGLLDTITSTAESKDCPGRCVHALATIICYEVLEDVPCPSSSMKCCVEPPPLNTTIKTTTPAPATTTGTVIADRTVMTTTTYRTVSCVAASNVLDLIVDFFSRQLKRKLHIVP